MPLNLTPNIEPLFADQHELIKLMFEERRDRVFALAGRGWGKSIIGILCTFIAGMKYAKNSRITVTYPTYRDCIDVGKAKIFEVFPHGSFAWKESELTATLRYTNTQIALRSRDIKNSNRTGDIGRGPTNALVVHDEPAMDKSPNSCHAFNASVRGPGSMGVLYITTPKVGWLRDEVRKFGLDNCGWGVHRGEHNIIDPVTGDPSGIKGAVIHARTLDNIYGGQDLHRRMVSDLDDKWARQELDGLWVSMGGLLWDNWEWATWPNGNICNLGYDPMQPWYLSCDFGVTRSSWIVWQKKVLGGETRHVAVREYHPANEGAAQSFERIRKDFKPKKPAAIYSGHDHKTRSVSDSSLSPAFFASKIWGSVPMFGLSGLAMDKSVRHATMRALTSAADGERRILLSSKMDSYDPERRGFRRVLEMDEYGDRDLMQKDGFLEHCRDAIHHYLSAVDTPKIARDRRYA